MIFEGFYYIQHLKTTASDDQHTLVHRGVSREPYIALAMLAKEGASLAKAPTVSKYLDNLFSRCESHEE